MSGDDVPTLTRSQWDALRRLAARYRDPEAVERDLSELARLRASGAGDEDSGRRSWSPRDVLALQDRGLVSPGEARRLLGIQGEPGTAEASHPAPVLRVAPARSRSVRSRLQALSDRHLIHRLGWGATWRLGALLVMFVLPHRELLLAWLVAGLLMAAGVLSGAIRRRGLLGSSGRISVLAGAAYLAFYLPSLATAAVMAVLALAALADLVWTVGGSELALLRPGRMPPDGG